MEEIVEDLERFRKKIHMKRWIGVFYITLGILLLIYLHFKWYLCLAYLFIIIFGIYCTKKAKDMKEEYRLQYKNTLIRKIFETMFEEVDYDVQAGVSYDHLKSTNLKDFGNQAYSDNWLSGFYKGVPFTWTTVTCKEVIQKKDEIKEKEKFTGKYITFPIQKKFNGEVQLHTIPNYFLYDELEEIKFEDVKFGKMITTHASSQHDAFYLITPQWFDRIKKLIEHYNYNLDLCFKDGSIHVVVNDFSIDYFEPNFIRKINLKRAEETVTKAVEDIKYYIETLELYKLY